MGSFLPLFSSSPAEREKQEKKTHLRYFMLSRSSLCPLCLCERFCLADNACAKNASVISKACTHFAFYKFRDLAEAVTHWKVEQVTLLLRVAQGHIKKDTWLLMETVAAVGNKPVTVSQDMLPQANISLPERWGSGEFLKDCEEKMCMVHIEIHAGAYILLQLL